MRRRAELLYQQLDGLQALRRNLRPEFLAESRKHKAAKLLRQIPCIGPIRAARLIALMQTPHRFRSKRQLWTYSGLGIETHDSAQYRYVGGQVQRSKKPQQIRGLNQNHNHEMKEIFKSTAIRASCGMGPFNRRLLAMRKCILRSIAIVSACASSRFPGARHTPRKEYPRLRDCRSRFVRMPVPGTRMPMPEERTPEMLG